VLRPAASDDFPRANHNAGFLAPGHLSEQKSNIAILDKPPKRISKTHDLLSAIKFSTIFEHGKPAFVKEARPGEEETFAGAPE
jgi:hypothetical protein